MRGSTVSSFPVVIFCRLHILTQITLDYQNIPTLFLVFPQCIIKKNTIKVIRAMVSTAVDLIYSIQKKIILPHIHLFWLYLLHFVRKEEYAFAILKHYKIPICLWLMRFSPKEDKKPNPSYNKYHGYWCPGWRKEGGHQQIWYWLNCPAMIRFQHLKGLKTVW